MIDEKESLRLHRESIQYLHSLVQRVELAVKILDERSESLDKEFPGNDGELMATAQKMRTLARMEKVLRAKKIER